MNPMKNAIALSAICLAAAVGVPAQAGDANSLYDPASYQPLVADQKAYKAGDALTVLIQEAAAASTSVDSKAGRDTSVNLGVQATGHRAHGLEASAGSTTDGGGQTQRSGRVTAQITVSVLSVQPNGELVVGGQQTVELNGEQQVITVAGRVRPRDINEANAVLSGRLADSRITYTGQGHLSEKSKPGVLSWVFDYLGL
ncbi:MAG: flagellar basal body L-ring protein FlgH [Aquabacterium sp.]|nr:MAG: flagellar basal body L-ring protein FlgH [Aquabacterium sp.]TAL22075.1 MAG: flagellar basal body L-ring protein FlgH [Aquabacterium sp.]